MAAQTLPLECVSFDPDYRGGRPVVAGTTLRISDLAAYHTVGGLSADQLAVQFSLDLGRIHGALAYYYQNKANIDAEIRANAEEAERWRQLLTAQERTLSL